MENKKYVVCELCNSKIVEELAFVKDKRSAQNFAVEIQNLTSENDFSIEQLINIAELMEDIAKKFDLVEEFKENGII